MERIDMDDYMLTERVLIDEDTADIDDIEDTLDDAGVNYDWDSAGRLMVSTLDLTTACEALDEIGADYDVI